MAAPPGAGHTSIGRITIGEEINAVLSELAATLPQTDFTAELLADLTRAYAVGNRMSDGFARVLERWLGDLGLVVFECSDGRAKSLVSGIFSHELKHPGRTWALADDAGKRLASLGYHTQVDASSQTGTALFHLDGSRTPIGASEARALEGEALAHPEMFSPNVLLRPIVQDALFPTVSYVSGPNELAYLGQLRHVYEHFGIPMPLVVPRASATVLDSAAARFLEKYDVPFESLQARDESALNRLLAASLPDAVDRALKDADNTMQE
jgi:uncharacterized protein YllA (UPF0747 family)